MSQQPQGAVNRPSGQQGYDVARTRGQCMVCQALVEEQQPLMAALRETHQGFERLDICMNCWPAFEKTDLIGFWRTIMRKPEQKKKLFVDDQVLGQVFERLADAQEPAKVNFRFVLALILMRKRLLVLEDSRPAPADLAVGEGAELWTVRFRGRDDRMELLNPRLNDQQIIDVSMQLGEILNEEI